MYNNKPSEFEVQSLAYSNLKKFFPIVRGEYKIKGARFDIAIFDSQKNLKLIIEVKKSKTGYSIAQGERYTELTQGIPVLYCRGMDEAYHIVDRVYKFIKENKIYIN